MFTGDLCGVPSQFFRHVSSAFVDSLGYFAQAFSRIYPCFDLYSIRQCHSTHVSLLSAGCDRNYYTAYCRGERHPITTFLPLKCYLHFCNQPVFWDHCSTSAVLYFGLLYLFFVQLREADKHILLYRSAQGKSSRAAVAFSRPCGYHRTNEVRQWKFWSRTRRTSCA